MPQNGSLHLNVTNEGVGSRIGTGMRKGRGEGTIGDRRRLGFCWIWVRRTHSKEQKRKEAEELSTLYLLSTANNVMCRRAIVCKGRGEGCGMPQAYLWCVQPAADAGAARAARAQ